MFENHSLKNGTEVIVRPLVADDAPKLEEGLQRLSVQTCYQRFLSHKRGLSKAQLEYLTRPDFITHAAFCMVADFDTDSPRGVGVARCFREDDYGNCVEIAVTVADEWQAMGAGRILFGRIARWAIEHGVERWRGTMLETNKVAEHLMCAFGTPTARRLVSPGVIELTVALGIRP